jgi:hypothetical protein
VEIFRVVTRGKYAARRRRGVKPFDGVSGSFKIADGRSARFRAQAPAYAGKHHLQFAGTKDYFLSGATRQTLLAYADFDGTNLVASAGLWEASPMQSLITAPHLGDWCGRPVGKGQGRPIGAGTAGKGVNVFSFLPYNAGGDGDDVWPFVERDAKFHYDCSKLDQWAIAFDHATARGLYLHFKLQENELDDNRRGMEAELVCRSRSTEASSVRSGLYCRELIALSVTRWR